MQEQKRVHGEEYKKLLEEVNKLRSEKEQQQKLLAQSLLLSEDARIEASMKHEITRLTNDNLVGPLYYIIGHYNYIAAKQPSLSLHFQTRINNFLFFRSS